MLQIHLKVRLNDGRSHALQLLAESTFAAVDAAHSLFGDALRGANASVLPLRAPGLMGIERRRTRLACANDERFSQVRA